jgi:cell division protein ZapE
VSAIVPGADPTPDAPDAAADAPDAARPLEHPLTVAAASGFRRRVRDSGLALDAEQHAAVDALSEPAVEGYYLWGPVGRGKTVLAEHYLAAVPGKTRRFHFHGFFRDLQREIFGGGVSLTGAIARVVGPAQAVLFDEFHVHDVADAVYLTAVLRWLRDEGVLLIATSNYAPADLLPDPEYHHQFVPAIALIEELLTVVPLGEGVDYRGGVEGTQPIGFAAGTWRVAASDAVLQSTVALDPDGVRLRAVSAETDGAVFTFEELCGRPLAANQYLWLADRFRRLTLRAMPDPAEVGREPLQRFGILVDILHDRDVALDVTAAGPPERILDAAAPPRDAARAVSRLALLRGC